MWLIKKIVTANNKSAKSHQPFYLWQLILLLIMNWTSCGSSNESQTCWQCHGTHRIIKPIFMHLPFTAITYLYCLQARMFKTWTSEHIREWATGVIAWLRTTAHDSRRHSYQISVVIYDTSWPNHVFFLANLKLSVTVSD